MVLHPVEARTQEKRTGIWMMAAVLSFSLRTCLHFLASSVASVQVCCPCCRRFLFYFEVCDPRLPVKFPTCVIGLPNFMCSNCVSLSPSTNIYNLLLPFCARSSCCIVVIDDGAVCSCVRSSILELCPVAWLFDLLVVEPSDSLLVFPLSSWQEHACCRCFTSPIR